MSKDGDNFMNKYLKIARVSVSVIAILYSFYIMIVPWYFSADSRSVLSDLEFVSEKANEAGIQNKINVKGLNVFRHPKPVALMELTDLTSNWTYSYLSAVELIHVKTKENYKNYSDKTNPYDTISRLNFIVHGDDAEKEAYELIKYHIGISNPDTVLTHELLEQYAEDTKTIETELTKTYKKYYEHYQNVLITGLFIIFTTAFINGLIYLTQHFITQKKI